MHNASDGVGAAALAFVARHQKPRCDQYVNHWRCLPRTRRLAYRPFAQALRFCVSGSPFRGCLGLLGPSLEAVGEF